MTAADFDGDWRRERDDYIAGRLADDDDRRDFEAQRDVDLGIVPEPAPVPFDDMVDHWARDRREVEDRWELARIAELALIAQYRRDRDRPSDEGIDE